MENKIQVEEYIRTYEGIIGKIKRIELDEIDKSLKWYVFDKKRYDINIIDEIYINKPYIKKHSFNIIDLLEVEDIVKMKDNDMDYLEIIYINDKKMLEAVREDSEDNNIKIVSIITKKQLESMEYEV